MASSWAPRLLSANTLEATARTHCRHKYARSHVVIHSNFSANTFNRGARLCRQASAWCATPREARPQARNQDRVGAWLPPRAPGARLCLLLRMQLPRGAGAAAQRARARARVQQRSGRSALAGAYPTSSAAGAAGAERRRAHAHQLRRHARAAELQSC
jgi:hypothetical protein